MIYNIALGIILAAVILVVSILIGMWILEFVMNYTFRRKKKGSR